MIRRLAVAAIVSIAGVLAAVDTRGQQPRTLSGQVEVEDNGRRLPVRRVAVTISSDTAKATQTTFTDNDGRYQFSSVGAGRYRVVAAKPGFLQLQPSVAGAADGTVNIDMQRAAALEGRFIEDSGRPIAGLLVHAEGVSQPGAYSAKTDDFGRFRIHTIPPGQYRVHATPPSPASGAKHFYPGTENVGDAMIVTVVSGQTLDGLMVAVPMPPLSAMAAEAMATAELEAIAVPPTGSRWGQISGRATRTDSGQPVVNAAVKLSFGGVLIRTAWTDGDGAYVFNRTMMGRYSLRVVSDGHVSPGATPATPSGAPTTVDLGDGERLKKDLLLIPLSAIEGRVTDEFGDGVPGVQLQVAQRITTAGDGEARLLPVRIDRSLAPTDDRGWFRASGLPPGDYYVVAIPPPFSPSGPAPFPLTYFPGTTSWSAADAVRISAGIDAHGVNFAVPIVSMVTIAGIAADPRGRSLRTSINLVPVEDGQLRIPARLATPADEAGRFRFPAVPEGSYVLQAGGGGMYGSTLVSVTASTGPELNVRFVLQPLGTLRGRVTFEGEPPAARLVPLFAFALRILPTDFSRGPAGGAGSSLMADINPDFTFSMKNIAWPGVIRPSGPEGRTVGGWALARVLLQGRDITDTPYDFQSGDTEGLEVVFTRRVGGITGTVLGEDSIGVNVYVLGADSDSIPYLERTLRVTAPTPAKAGEFAISGLLPGRYYAVATTRGLRDPASLLALRSLGTLVVVSEGIDASVRLTVVK